VLLAIDDALLGLRQMEGVTPEQLASFHRVPGGWVEGELLGLRIAALEWQHLRALALEGPVAVDIDTDYFVKVPQGPDLGLAPRHRRGIGARRWGMRSTSPSRGR
jgi:hypothetical protein